VFENSFPLSARPILRRNLARIRSTQPAAPPHLDPASHKLWRTSDGKQFSDTL